VVGDFPPAAGREVLNPVALAVDGAGNLYVVDSVCVGDGNRIRQRDTREQRVGGSGPRMVNHEEQDGPPGEGKGKKTWDMRRFASAIWRP
jgi:hypothetical protein